MIPVYFFPVAALTKFWKQNKKGGGEINYNKNNKRWFFSYSCMIELMHRRFMVNDEKIHYFIKSLCSVLSRKSLQRQQARVQAFLKEYKIAFDCTVLYTKL